VRLNFPRGTASTPLSDVAVDVNYECSSQLGPISGWGNLPVKVQPAQSQVGLVGH